MQEVSLLNSDGDEAAEPPRRYPREKPTLERGLLVFHRAFGIGKVVGIQDKRIVVKFGKTERVTREPDLITRDEAEINWHAYWLRGEKRRLLEGKLLWIVKGLCRRFGEWQAFLDRYEYPRSTADDLIRHYKEVMAQEAETQQLPGNRSIKLEDPDPQPHERTADPEAEELEELVAQETEKRRGKKPTYHPTLWSVRIKLPPDILKRCRKKYKEPGSKKFWRRAAYRFVGLNPVASDSNRQNESSDSH